MEIFKEIEGFSNYEVSNFGNVRNKKTGRVLKPKKNNCGYLEVSLRKDGKKKMFYVHRLVAIDFIENPRNKKEVNHINGIKTDNRVENLEWVTHQENQLHSFKYKLSSNDYKRKKVRCIETNQEFESILSASRCFECYPMTIRRSIYNGHKVKGKYHFELI